MRSVVVLFMLAIACSLSAHAAGAIATDDEENGAVYALVTGAASREDAGNTALAECRRNGGKNCKVMARFDRCGAYAALAGKRLYGAGWGDSGEVARSMALAKCADHSCKVQALECE
ncbi:MAG: hypothetical protein JWR22_859 [Herminiimonas sp.]|nr:hypothetical protein [Herminiimonas sp.]